MVDSPKATWKKLRFVLAADWPSEGRHRFVSGLAPMVRSRALGFGRRSVAIQTCPAPCETNEHARPFPSHEDVGFVDGGWKCKRGGTQGMSLSPPLDGATPDRMCVATIESQIFLCLLVLWCVNILCAILTI